MKLKDFDLQAFFMGILAVIACVSLAALASRGAAEPPQPQGIIITSLEPVIVHDGRMVWYVDYIIDGEVQPSVICPTEEYARRLIAYLEKYRAAEWRGE